MAPRSRYASTADHRWIRLVVVAAALSTLTLLAGCGADGDDGAAGTTTTTESGGTTTTTESGGTTTTLSGVGGDEVTMEAAEGWTDVPADAVPDSVVAAFAAPAGGDFTPNVNLLVEEGRAGDLDEYWEASEEGLAAVPDAEVTETRSKTEMDGHPAYQKVWTAKSSSQEVQFWSVLSAVDGDGYVFTYTATPDTFDEHRGDAEKIFDSIQIPG